MECKIPSFINTEEEIDRISQKAYEQYIPLNVHFELTAKCNLRCVHCYVVEDEKRKELSCDEIKGLLDQLAEAGGLYLTLTGGEVLLRDDFFEIASYAGKRHFALRIFTNGTLITEDTADRIADLNPLTVEMSLYGSTPKTHDSITGVPGSFEKVKKAILLLKERRITIILKTVLMKPNFEELKEVYDLVEKMGIETHHFDIQVCPREDGSKEPLKYQLDEESIVEYFKGEIPEKTEFIDELPFEEAIKKEICSPATIGCAVSSYGDIYPCPILYTPLGNIREKSFKEIWYADTPFLKKLRAIKSYSDIPECSDCPVVSHCQRCHGIAHLLTGRIEARDEFACRDARILKKLHDTCKGKGGL